MMKVPDSKRGLVRRSLRWLGLAAVAMFVLSAVSGQRAEALSLINAGGAPTAKYASDGLMTAVRGHGGGGGHHGGGFHGGFHGGRAAFHGGGFRGGHVFHGGGFRHGGFAFRHHRFHRNFYYAPSYSYYPYRRCPVVWTHYGPRRICHYRHWRHHHRRHHVYW